MLKFPFYQQHDQRDCGATCLRMICKFYKRNVDIRDIRDLTKTNKNGVNLFGLGEAAEKLGFRTQGVSLEISGLKEVQLPCILHWRQNHFIVLYKIKGNSYYTADPSVGLRRLDRQEIVNGWLSFRETNDGIALLLDPSPNFFEREDLERDEKKALDWSTMFKYFYKYRRLLIQLVLGLVVGTILQMITPFLTQSIVDFGINTSDIDFIYLILIAQLMLFVGQTGVTFIRSWILLHVSTRINIAVLTDMIIKLMKLPMEYFDIKTHGDLMQRMGDQQRIESFLTGSSLSTFFSLINLVVFGMLLLYFDFSIFIVFFISTILYTLWILLFMKRRRMLDQRRFGILSDNQTVTVELIQSMTEIKLNNSERQKRWGWEAIQARLFKFKVASLSLTQFQQAGSMAINQLKNIIITFISAKAVIEGNLTLGGMMAVQYIVGMVNSPIEQLLTFLQQFQDAKISLERINEIYIQEDEESNHVDWIQDLPHEKSIQLKDVTFRYREAGADPVLKNVNICIPAGKTTAIVGMSGSGKTTILKLILRFYQPENGEILIGNTKLNRMSFKIWRQSCGVVLQDGFIFADTIENNIAIGQEYSDKSKLEQAIKVANLQNFIEEQPFGLKTKIGASGKGLSQGQKQRLLIARAVYKDPEFMFFDEATNALDANNEKVIVDNLNKFLVGRTVIIVAHRLSTVSSADNIIVMDQGELIEQGTHEELIKLRGGYYQLIKNQLELGN